MTNRVSRDRDERETRKRGSQTIERKEGIKRRDI